MRRVPLTDCLRHWPVAGKEKAPLNFRSIGAPTIQPSNWKVSPKTQRSKGDDAKSAHSGRCHSGGGFDVCSHRAWITLWDASSCWQCGVRGASELRKQKLTACREDVLPAFRLSGRSYAPISVDMNTAPDNTGAFLCLFFGCVANWRHLAEKFPDECL